MSALDRLLGRASLRERVEELETELDDLRAERDSLERQLEAESDRRADAVTARQEAAERVNRLEDRIAQLEGDLDRETEREELSFRGVERLGLDATERVLDTLDGVAPGRERALTATVDVGDGDGDDDGVPEAAREAFGDRTPLLSRAAPCVAVTDDDGLVSAALSPPVSPASRVTWSDGFELERSNYLPRGRYSLAAVRADVFAVGVYEGRERVTVEGFRSEVKGDHSKGGFSQARFERLRDEQIDAHLDRCRTALSEHAVEPLYLVGDRAAVDRLAETVTPTPAATDAVDATGDPETTLSAAFREFWTTRLYLV
ncbi:hypothetical protein BRD18_06585 [Halobacteriales archaeon SW_7_71_33]|nr:MAG: hypothetical protein BRD18_06585 [Halobacteriales archaeon SW_7_71_33]